MAYSMIINCFDCGKQSTVTFGSSEQPTICNACRQRKETERRDQYFAELDKLSTEERIRKIEEWIYDYRPQYVSPPRF